MNILKKKRVLITGASRGIGRALACQYAKEEAYILLIGRDEAALKETSEQVAHQGATAQIQCIDITDTEALLSLLRQEHTKHPFDIVIANAGLLGQNTSAGDFESVDDTFEKITRTNFEATLALSIEAVNLMRATTRTGTVVIISSLAGLKPISTGPLYSATKAGLIAWAEAANELLIKDPINICMICPGFVKTPMAENYVGNRPFEMTADRAAIKIKRAIDAKKDFYAFPKYLYWAICAANFLPRKLRLFITRLLKL